MLGGGRETAALTYPVNLERPTTHHLQLITCLNPPSPQPLPSPRPLSTISSAFLICFCFCSKYFYSLLGVTGCPKLAFVACYICTFCLYSNVNEQSDNYTDLTITHSYRLSVCQDLDWAGLYVHLRMPAAVDN